MPSESNHIDNFFWRKENAFTADTSHMDTHWKQLREVLPGQPFIKTSGVVKLKKLLQYAAIVLMIAAISLLLFQFRQTGKQPAITHFKPDVVTEKKETNPPGRTPVNQAV